jgi:hypothetical protein
MGAGFGNGYFPGTKGGKQIRYPGNNSAVSPGPGFEWRGKGKVGEEGRGSWYNPDTRLVQ